MDRTILVKIIRDDAQEFKIGAGQTWQLLTKGLERWGTYENQINYTDNAIGDGGIIASTRLTKTDRTIKCVNVDFMNNDAVRSQVQAFFNPKRKYKIYVTYAGATRWAEGYIYKYALPSYSLDKRLELTITFIFATPYLKSVDDFGKDIASVDGKVAFPYICTSETGTTGGVYNFSQTVVLNNAGDVPTKCKAVFTASDEVLNPKLIINDAYVRVIDTMHVNDTIEMDFTASPPTVKKNGVNCLGKCDRTSSFDEMVIDVGDTEIAFDADDGSRNLKVSIYYNQLYITI